MDQTGTEMIVEAQPQVTSVRGDLNFKLLVMRQIDRCGMLLMKLPHEYELPNSSVISGCKYQDIQNSFCDCVLLLESLIAVYADKQFTEGILKAVAGREKDKEVYFVFFKRYAECVKLCDRMGLLLENTGVDGE